MALFSDIEWIEAGAESPLQYVNTKEKQEVPDSTQVESGQSPLTDLRIAMSRMNLHIALFWGRGKRKETSEVNDSVGGSERKCQNTPSLPSLL